MRPQRESEREREMLGVLYYTRSKTDNEVCRGKVWLEYHVKLSTRSPLGTTDVRRVREGRIVDKSVDLDPDRRLNNRSNLCEKDSKLRARCTVLWQVMAGKV